MPLNRREFLRLAEAAGMLGLVSSPTFGQASGSSRKVKAIAFDAFPIFDPRPIFALVEHLFAGKGAELGNAWRMRQFEYTWLRSTADQYKDFWKVTEDALVFAAKSLKLELTAEKREQLMAGYLQLEIYRDVVPALKTLKEMGIRLGFLSNFTHSMLSACLKRSGLEDFFEQILSTDRVEIFKPAPSAYQMGIDAFRLKREEILFAAFGGWDAAGAKWFGYRTFWVNRFNTPVEELNSIPDGVGSGLGDLVTFVKELNEPAKL